MNKKVVISIVGIILVVAGGYMLTKKDSNKSTATDVSKTSTTIEQKDAEDPRALQNIVDISTIKSALGAAAKLTGPNNTGVTSLGGGDKGQTWYIHLKKVETNLTAFTQI